MRKVLRDGVNLVKACQDVTPSNSYHKVLLRTIRALVKRSRQAFTLGLRLVMLRLPMSCITSKCADISVSKSGAKGTAICSFSNFL